jgi:cell division protein FtsL
MKFGFRKILILSFSFIFIGILIAFVVDRYQIHHIRRQNEELFNQINKSMRDLDSLDKQIKTLNDKEIVIDSSTGQLEIK